jgi:hypothetical protein
MFLQVIVENTAFGYTYSLIMIKTYEEIEKEKKMHAGTKNTAGIAQSEGMGKTRTKLK